MIDRICELYRIEDYGSKINYSLAVKKYQPEKKARIVSDILSTVMYIVEEDAMNTEQIEEISQTVKAKSYISDEMWSMAESAFRGAVAGVNAVIAGKYYVGGEESESGQNSIDDIFIAGKNAFDNFDINNAYVKPKHLSTTGGNGQKFIGASKAEAESVLKDALSNGKIVSISDNGLTKAGNVSYEIVIDAGKKVGTKGESLVKIVISSDGGMLSAYPIK